MKKTILFSFIALFAFLFFPGAVKAYDFNAREIIKVPADKTIEDNLYAFGSLIIIDGHVTGDVVCAGQNIEVNGIVDGDVICAGENITINGQVNSSVRLAGNNINVDCIIGRNLNAFGNIINIKPENKVGIDALVVGSTANVDGEIKGDLHGAAAIATISGNIGRNVNLKLDGRNFNDISPLTISDNAIIKGNLIYESGREADIKQNSQISGDTFYKSKDENYQKNIYALAIWQKILSIFSALIIGLILISLNRKLIKNITENMLNKIIPTLSRGLIVLFLSPLVCLILLFTLIGIPLALILFALWLIAIYISKILVGILIGKILLENFWKKNKDSLIIAMVIGIILTWIIYAIPIIGWLLSLFAVIWGLGGIWLSLKKT